jgi:phospholipid-transporting ATPase
MGQVEFIFSDKTGTLTCNVMEFKQCSINGRIFENLDQAKKLFDLSIKKTNNDALDMKACHEFFKHMAVCHTVVLDTDKKTGKPLMQASSPDELALVQGSFDVGFKFIEKTSEYIKIEIDYLKKVEKYFVITEFPFDSTRKRMSLIVKEELSGNLYLMTKGADSIMLPRTTLKPLERKLIDEHLYKFACTGLRTLVMAQK